MPYLTHTLCLWYRRRSGPAPATGSALRPETVGRADIALAREGCLRRWLRHTARPGHNARAPRPRERDKALDDVLQPSLRPAGA